MPKYKAKSGYLKNDTDKRVFSSKAEAYYYLYLCDELEKGNIAKFRYEKRRFKFTSSRLTYLCDFEVWMRDGSYKVIELKGKMSSRDRRLKKLLRKEYATTDIRYVFTNSIAFRNIFDKYRYIVEANFVEHDKTKRRKGDLLKVIRGKRK